LRIDLEEDCSGRSELWLLARSAVRLAGA
jgi:hypothetical protein